MSDIYVVVIINLIVWLGIFSYLISLNMQLKKLEKKCTDLTMENGETQNES